MAEQPPTIDIGELMGPDPAGLERVAARLEEPCRQWGVFHIVGHGIPADELAAFDASMQRFFDAPREVKRGVVRTRDNARGYYDEELTKNRPDWKEVFDYGAEAQQGEAHVHSDGVNQWPGELPEIRPILIRHHARCLEVGVALLRAICASLGWAPDRIEGIVGDRASFVRLNRYPLCPDPAPQDAEYFPAQGALGVHHHTDAGLLTLLYQDGVPGLQAEYQGRFVLVEPVPGALTVNLADMLQVLSNDVYRSPLHRVIARSDRVRHSAPFFLNPRYEVVCEPLLEGANAGAEPRYRPVSWAHFRDQRSAGDFKDYGAEIQISEYRVD